MRFLEVDLRTSLGHLRTSLDQSQDQPQDQSQDQPQDQSQDKYITVISRYNGSYGRLTDL